MHLSDKHEHAHSMTHKHSTAAATADLRALIQGRIRQVQDEGGREPWAHDHKTAMACMSLEESIRVLIEAFDALVRVDEFVRDAAVDRRISGAIYSDLASAIHGGFTVWVPVCERALKGVERYESANYKVELAPKLRQYHSDIRWALTDAKTLFDNEAFVVARDRAVDDLRSGRCLPEPE